MNMRTCSEYVFDICAFLFCFVLFSDSNNKNETASQGANLKKKSLVEESHLAEVGQKEKETWYYNFAIAEYFCARVTKRIAKGNLHAASSVAAFACSNETPSISKST